MSEDRLKELEQKIEYSFRNKQLLKQAVTHSSYSNEQKINKYGNYERLEFLGDAVLELVSSNYIYQENPDMTERQMTKRRAWRVCEPALSCCATQLGLEK